MKILLIGEPPNVAKMANHLSQYGEVEWLLPSKFSDVPYGTAWVIVMNAGGKGGAIFAAAGRSGAKAVSVPPGWSQAHPKLEGVGFFKAAALAKGEDPHAAKGNGLTQRPFAGIADALAAKKDRERAENERKAAAAVERALNPPPVAPEEPDRWEEEPEAAAPEPESLTQSEETPVEVPTVVDDAGKHVFFTPEARALGILTRRVRSEAKEERLRQIYEWNPDLAISDAQAMLAAVATDGRALSWTRMSEIRDEVREAKGLPTGVRRASKLTRAMAPKVESLPMKGHPGHPVPMQGCPECEASREPGYVYRDPTLPPEVTMPPPPAVPAPAPAALPAGHFYGALPLPKNVADAARLLGEELAAAGVVGSFRLEWKQGDAKPRVRWVPVLGESDAVL